MVIFVPNHAKLFVRGSSYEAIHFFFSSDDKSNQKLDIRADPADQKRRKVRITRKNIN